MDVQPITAGKIKRLKLKIIDEDEQPKLVNQDKSLKLETINEDKPSKLVNENKILKLKIIENPCDFLDNTRIINENKTLKLKIIETPRDFLDNTRIINENKTLKLKIIENPHPFLHSESSLDNQKVINEDTSLKLINENIKIPPIIQYPSDHMCYILKSFNNRIYVGYTVDFKRRLRQHNGELVGGAKKTEKGRPWHQICEIKGFYDKSSALRFEWRIQHSKKPKPNSISNLVIILTNLLNKGDGVLPWPSLTIKWI